MIKDLNEKLVFDTFNFEYDEEKFKVFINDLLVGANFEKAQRVPLPPDDKFTDFIRSAKRICKYEYIDPEYSSPKVIDVLVVKLKKSSSVERARTAQRNFVSRYLNGSRNYQKDAALVAFISEDENGNISPDWRFSFIQMNYVTKFVETANGKKKLKTEVELTPAKRFSFLVGANEDTHTAQQQLKHCLDKSKNNEKITVEDLVAAFDIEKVSKEFFDEYKKLYLKLVAELKRLYDSNTKIFNDFNDHNINIEDFAKKTMGQLVFLYFIQKKGWLGVKADNEWGTGDKKFLRNVFDKKYCDYDNFFNDILEHLFYEALASDRGKAAEFGMLKCRIPFLNGGLFEPVNGYEWTKTDLTIDNNIFKEIFDTFDLYNFTVKEDEPLEKEVAVDPEMLGKVFENLLPENIRKGNGAFYTPREIVHYMCQESLINYLYNKINIKQVELSPEEKAEQQTLFKKKKIDQLKLTQDVLEEIISKEDIEFYIKTGTSTYTNKTRKISVELPESIINNANIVDKALSEIKVCDPAIGSGAFPVGMMNEIVRARAALSEFVGQKDRSIYELKSHAIENSIYGVDIDAGAVDIAKLRFWLSLVVDEEDVITIKPLPNLDYKIMQGNSLITSYEGIDFDEVIEEYKPNTQLQINLWGDKSQDLKLELRNKMSKFIKTSHSSEKDDLKQEIENLIFELVKETLELKAKEGKINFQEVEEKVRNFAQNKENRNFFPWKLFFADAFENGGFDVVIGNPPYVGEKGHKEIFRDIKTCNLKEFYQRKMDLFYFFFHLALNISKNNACCGFITTNYYITAFGATNLRTDLKNRSRIDKLINFNELKIFDSALGQHNMITLFIKGVDNEYCANNLITNKTGVANNNILQCILNYTDNETEYYKTKQIDLYDSDENYIRINGVQNEEISNELLSVLNKIQNGNQRIGELCKVSNGILTGVDRVSDKHIKKGLIDSNFANTGVYVLTSEELSNLNLQDNEKFLIKPFFKNSDIGQYYTKKNNDKHLIYVTRDLEIEDFPNIKNHLDIYKDVINSRSDARGEIQAALKIGKWWVIFAARNKDVFENEKIVFPQRSKLNTFGYNNQIWYACSDVFFISPLKDDVPLKYVLALINSNLYYVWLYNKGKRKGEYLELTYTPITEIPIKQVSKEIRDKFINIVDKILNITNTDDYIDNTQKQQAVKEYENQIDIMVYKLYDLTYSEVKTIDSDFS